MGSCKLILSVFFISNYINIVLAADNTNNTPTEVEIYTEEINAVTDLVAKHYLGIVTKNELIEKTLVELNGLIGKSYVLNEDRAINDATRHKELSQVLHEITSQTQPSTIKSFVTHALNKVISALDDRSSYYSIKCSDYFSFSCDKSGTPKFLFHEHNGEYVINKVIDGSDAYLKGIRVGDVINSVNWSNRLAQPS